MNSLEKAVEAADGPWPVIAIAIIGLYLLIWKFGAQLLTIGKTNQGLAKDAVKTASLAKDQVQAVADQMVTNHGSKNLGAAIDRLTEWMLLHLEESRNGDEQLRALRLEFMQHLVTTDSERGHFQTTLADIDTRLSQLETLEKKGA